MTCSRCLFNLDRLKAAIDHPRVFAALVTLDPFVLPERVNPSKYPVATQSARLSRRVGSLEEAENYFRSRSAYRKWDKRVLDLHLVRPQCLTRIPYLSR
jgi:hypothetical protein